MSEEEEKKEIKCPLCGIDGIYFKGLHSLSFHWSKTHKKKSKELYLMLNGLEKEPTCKCGCGEGVKYLGVVHGFREYVRGHISRIKNNYRTEKSVSNSLNTRRKMLEEGTWKPFALNETGTTWCHGLTKDTDERVARMAHKLKTEHGEMYADKLRRGRLDGTIRTLRGKEHSQWKGGVSSLNGSCRSNKRLYQEWKYPKLVASAFKCEKCGDGNEIQVHHDKEKFSEIMRKIASEEKWEDKIENMTPEERSEFKYKITNMVADYHVNHNVSGIVLCYECHKEAHGGVLNLRNKSSKGYDDDI